MVKAGAELLPLLLLLEPNKRASRSSSIDVGAAVAAFDRGATLFRVHDVAAHVDALAVAAAIEQGTSS